MKQTEEEYNRMLHRVMPDGDDAPGVPGQVSTELPFDNRAFLIDMEEARDSLAIIAAWESDTIANEALDECRTSLMMAFRYMDIALWKMPFQARELEKPLASDGRALYYDAPKVLERYAQGPNELVRDYLHAILHCIFRHQFDRSDKAQRQSIWWAACDIAIEGIALEICGKRFPSKVDVQFRSLLKRVRETRGGVTPQKLFKEAAALEDAERMNSEEGPSEGGAFSLKEFWAMARMACRDDHQPWLLNADGKDDSSENPQGPEHHDEADGADADDEDVPVLKTRLENSDELSDQEDRRTDNAVTHDEDRDFEPAHRADGVGDEDSFMERSTDAELDDEDAKQLDLRSDDQEQQQGDGGLQTAGDSFDQAQRDWERIGKQVAADLETFSLSHGEDADDLMANLIIANRQPIDYTDFLKRFATITEETRLSEDEFDYIFYTYGLDHYGNMPLIEPLEYCESNRVREFVIAIDTSGSCSGELVYRFIERTYEILKSSGQFDETINVHIIQCDAKVQSDTLITSVDDLREYEHAVEIRGHGGTDFRPVFDYVDELLEEGSFEDLRGLIYFTDGLGIFPKHHPPYETAFVFVDEEGARRKVPPWAMKVIMDEDMVREL